MGPSWAPVGNAACGGMLVKAWVHMGRGGSWEVARRILGESSVDPRRIHPKQPPQLGPSWAPVGSIWECLL